MDFCTTSRGVPWRAAAAFNIRICCVNDCLANVFLRSCSCATMIEKEFPACKND